jgi:ATP-dependent Lon protease
MTNLTKQNTVRRVPIVPIRGSVVFPHSDTLLSFGREKSVSAINSAFQEDRVVAIFTQKDPRTSDPGAEDLYETGTIATITQMMSTEGEVHALIRGQARISLEEVVTQEPFLIGLVREISEEIGSLPEISVMAKKLQELFKKAVNLGKQAEIMTVMKLVSGGVEPIELSDQIASVLEIKPAEKQKILEEPNLKKRLEKVTELLSKEVNALEIERTISSKTQKRFEDQMKKAMLREKKRTIEKELGEMDEDDGELTSEEIKEYKLKIKEAGMPSDVHEKAEKELKRLAEMSPNNPEGAYLRNYLDWLTDMPWSKVSPNNVAIKKAAKILEDEHYGIDKAKERILEFLAVMKIKKDQNGKKDQKSGNSEAHPTILCFIGPPGVGKTSIGRSIAKALNRKFVRVSLGGIRDEAEIRGHRRTYVGALPGRIIQGVKDAGTKNPVFMLDEIDKIGVDFRGDPSSALLEALDPEQNKEFSDHYLEVPFDLSQVMFICTGNILDTIPAPLKDRMEIITFPGYTETEKFKIARKFLWPKTLKANGIEGKKVDISEAGLKEVINSYTREAGVRGLERNLASVCRKVARQVAEGKKYSKNIDTSDVRKFLGSQRFTSQIAGKKDEIGQSTGLSVTTIGGGEILFIEVSLMPGKGKLLLTGQLGDVMRESAKAAFTWTRSHYHELGLKSDFAENIDVHIHVPEGAVPKDGPSAGVAITTALVSALTGIPIRREIGMTGEVTLRGHVLEIGGLKEKSIAGHRAGLKVIVAPKDNKKDLDEIPAEVKKDVKFVFAEEVEDVLKIALASWPIKVRGSTKFTPMSEVLMAN